MFISLKNKVLNYFQPKITIIFHIYYENEVPHLIERIRRIDKHYDVFITYSKELSAGTMHLLHSISKPIHFLRTENIGMDV
ncbi:rhamnan synthesis F family protein, partial [Leifsonia sp. SIMBA_070]|uniref:rhamnan synthesis F family protein n=1 Tax=Leifsonia sp. SIMBA_070 TaxID=3085810 RepID=UPI00397AFB32